MPRKEPASVPEFTSDRLRLYGPLVTSRAIELARARLIGGAKLVADKGKIPSGDSEQDVKIALLLLMEMNPFEDLSNEEQGLMRGISAATYGKRLAAHEIQTPV